MLGLLNTVLSKGNTLLTYVKDGLVMASRFLTPPKLTFPVDASAEFNGTSDYIQLNEPFSHTNHTIAAWVNIDSFTSWNAIFAAQDSSSDGIRFSITSDSRIYYRLNNSSVYPADTISANNWYHIAVNYDGSTLKVYLDGSLLGDYSSSTTINNSTNATIGKRSDVDADRVDGNLANVAIWNRALSSDEINSVMWKSYEQVSATESNGLQAWYKLNASEALSGDSTATLTTYANANALTFEAPACVQTALNAFPDITDARLYSANYDIRVSADGGNVESLNCVETELNAIL